MYKRDLKHQLRSIAAKSAAVVSGTLAAAGAAMAQTSTLSSGFSTEVTAQKPELLALGAIVLGVCAIVFIVRKARASSGG